MYNFDMRNDRYRHLNQFLKEKFGQRVLKVCVDGGFTCPNRDGTKGCGGCVFCSEKGSGEHIGERNIKNQIEKHFNSYRGQRAEKFVLYFQNFSNTYDSVENLKNKYDAGLECSDKFIGVAVATRPDCVDEDVAKLLASYAKKYYVWVELGLQTANEDTGKLINRCYSNQDFTSAVEILGKYNIDVVCHMMIGLPGETMKDVAKTVEFVNAHNIAGLKIHSTYVVKNSKLEKMWKKGDYKPLELEEYIDAVVYVVRHINPNVVLHRISGDAPKDLLVVPEWNCHKKWILNGIEKALEEENVFQGECFEEKSV